MHESLDDFGDDYAFRFVKQNGYIEIKNFKKTKERFFKLLPMKERNLYLEVSKSTREYETKLHQLKTSVIALQIILLVLFAFISTMMAVSALHPLQKSIEMLDKFAKDLIHDLNTPVTAMKLNLNILKKEPLIADNKALQRLDKSIYGISELYENLTVLLEEKTFIKKEVDLCGVIRELVETYRVIYPHLAFETECDGFVVKTNLSALRQILQNIISNACKYNRQNGFVKIFVSEKKLYIQDSGKGIRQPQKIFQRYYSAGHGSGIGLDIVRRLADAMELSIEVRSNEKGSMFILDFGSLYG